MTSAVFIDRDGTINREVGYLHRVEELRLIRGASRAIRQLNEAGLKTILVTNQAGVGRGYFAEACVDRLHDALIRRLARGGARLDGIFACLHHPEAGCACRKPNPGMLLHAAREFGVDLRRSFVVGDKLSDLDAGRRAGCRTVLVLTGHGGVERRSLHAAAWRPDLIASSIGAAVPWIMGETRPAVALAGPGGPHGR